jgi:hypothetical protein
VSHELAAVRRAPPTLDEAAEAIGAEVDALRKRGRPRLVIDGPKITVAWPDALQLAPSGQAQMAPTGSASALLCAMLPTRQLAELFAPDIERLTQGGIGKEERAQRTAALERELAVLECEEEALVTRALNDGIMVHRRPYASGFALLGLCAGLPPAEQPVLQAAE